MKHLLCRVSVCVIALLCMADTHAGQNASWGRTVLQSIIYAPQKFVYDVAVADVESFSWVLDRVSYLYNLYHADPFEESIVLVLYGDEIPFFAIEYSDSYRELMRRAQILTMDGMAKFRMYRSAAGAHGLEPDGIHGFVKMVPMADAEIIRQQLEEGYAHMR